MVSSAAAAMVKTAMDSTAAEKTDSKPAAEVETTLPVRLRPKKLSLSSEGRQGARQLLPNAPGARARQDHVAHIEQVSGGGGYFTCRAPRMDRDGGVGCARTWMLWRALSLKTMSMAPCLWAVAPTVAWVCDSGGGGAMASHAAGGDAKAGSVPWQGEAHLKNRQGAWQRAVWSGHLNRIRRPEKGLRRGVVRL